MTDPSRAVCLCAWVLYFAYPEAEFKVLSLKLLGVHGVSHGTVLVRCFLCEGVEGRVKELSRLRGTYTEWLLAYSPPCSSHVVRDAQKTHEEDKVSTQKIF